MLGKKILSLLLVMMLVGCSQTNTNNQTSSNKGYPITINHAFGQTVIKSKPKRIATIAWGNQDTPLALNVAPVGVSKANFGKLTSDGLAIWSKKAFTNLNVNKPNVYDDTDGLDFEAIANSEPDVILASYSGITKEDYNKLSQIAPVVAYKNKPWQTLWRDQTIQNATGMGEKEKGEALVKETEKLINTKINKYQLKGKKAAFAWIMPSDTSKFYIYLPTDPRAAYLNDLGFVLPDNIKALEKNSKEFSVTLSSEQATILNSVDVLVTYGDSQTLKALQKDPIFKQIKPIKEGRVAVIDSNSTLAAGATPTVLSIQATIDEYLTLIKNAIKS